MYIYFSECMPGYTGLNCTTKCPYPTYGERCQGYCDCSNNACDVSFGCIEITTSACMFLDIKFLKKSKLENLYESKH